MKLLALKFGPAVLLVAILFSASPSSPQERFHTIELPGKTLRLPADEWAPMRHSEPFAVNFSAREKADYEWFPRVVTVLKSPMQSDDRLGVEVAKGEYVEFFVSDLRITDLLIVESVRSSGGLVTEGLTMRVRLDRDGYWIQSRVYVRCQQDCGLRPRRGLRRGLNRVFPTVLI